MIIVQLYNILNDNSTTIQYIVRGGRVVWPHFINK